MDSNRASPFFGVMLNYDDPVDSSSQLPGDPRSSGIGPRKRRRGGRIYTGCGTCRSRKIKCDERRPRCYNCERSRLYECDGYDETPEATNNNRNTTPLLSYNSCDWTNALPDLDFAFWSAAQDFGLSAGQVADEHANSSTSTVGDASPVAAGDNITHDTTALDANHGQVENGSDSATLPNLPTPSPLIMSSLDPLPKSTEDIRRLLSHYRSHVCQLMMPTSAPSQNPWLRLYLPLAVQAAPCQPSRQVLLYSILAVAAFNRAHLTPADRASFRQQGDKYSEMANSMLKRILDQGDESGQLLYDKVEKQALMAAALTLTTVEVFSGGSKGIGYEHLRMCRRVIRATGGLRWWISDATSTTLLQIYRCLRIVASTSGWADSNEARDGQAVLEAATDNSPQDSELDDSMYETPLSRGDERIVEPRPTMPIGDYTLDITFGISVKTLGFLNETIELSRIKGRMGHDNTWASDAASRLIRLEQGLFDALDDFETLKDHVNAHLRPHDAIPSYVAEVIKDNHISAFHYSTIVFFRRALCNGSTDFVPRVEGHEARKRPTGQHLVSKALEHLENIDSLSHNISVADTLWPGFVAAVEAVDTDLRHRALVWLARAKRHGIGNVFQAVSLVMEVWRRVDRQWVEKTRGLESELGSVDWRQVMQEQGTYIMLT